MGLNIGFVSTRFAGTDGVSLEAAKWGHVFAEMGHNNYWFAGELDRDPAVCHHCPIAHFTHEEVVWVQERIFGRTHRDPEVTKRIHKIRDQIKKSLYEFKEKFNLDLIVPQNALTIPMHVPLGLAIAEFIAETGIATIAHHHDFVWERTRFSVNAIEDYIGAAFPPAMTRVKHVCINHPASKELAYRTGLSSTVVPNVIHFEKPAPTPDDYSKDVREEFDLAPDDIVVLQPTRIVPRKGIEHAIELLRQLGDPKYKLVISHAAGDEGTEYLDYLKEHASRSNVDMRIIADRVEDLRGTTKEGKKIYTLSDVYPHADFVTYPSLYEGFGNAFLETVYFKKPMLVNKYSVYQTDIEPLGFDCIHMDQYLTKSAVDEVREVLSNEKRKTEMVEKNYELALKYFSYTVLTKKLEAVLALFD